MTSFLSRIALEATSALTDAYSHVMHGDDAGSSAKVVWVVHPTRVPSESGVGSDGVGRFTHKFDLGLTFLEINDRAYIRTVEPGSDAERAGIQPEDCIQFACVVGGPKFDDLQQQQQQLSLSPSSPLGSNGRRRRGGVDMMMETETERLDATAKKYVLECEKRGLRTSYEQIRELFAGCTLPPKGAGATTGGDTNAHHHHSLRTPPRNGVASPRNNNAFDDEMTISSNSLMLADSMGGMFEHSKKNNINGSRRVPSLSKGTAKNVKDNFTNVARNAAGRCLMNDMDDDGDGSQLSGSRRRRSSTTSQLETPATPIKSDNVISTASPRHFGMDGVLEQELYPVVMVLRRTVQRKIVSPGGSGSVLRTSPGLSLKGSMLGIPTFRMDDECDRAAALVRQLAPANNSGESIPSSDQENDIEASIIRGMIKNAIGLGFVRLSKVVVGFSLQGGSGILVSRLPDGSWSAPSAIGVYGFGLGLQFGLEVADFIFIIQTQEGMEHFKRGGNFAVGGNIGATVVSCGREAYGAASIGACTGKLSLEDQVHQDDDGGSMVWDDRSMHSRGHSTVRTFEESKKKDSDGAPIVAYAKSQGLYFGVSVDGLKFFTRHDINARTYKFSMLSEVASHDILNGAVAPPPEAEDLYAALNGVEIINEVHVLPRSPLMFTNDSMNDWRYDRSIAAHRGKIIDESHKRSKSYPLFSFHSTLNREEANECAMFETKFKRFLYEGVTVQYLMPNLSPTLSGMTRREKRTLWLMLPEIGSLRLGLVSRQKQNRSDASTVLDDATAVSSVAHSVDEDLHRMEGQRINLSKRDSMSLTDITLLSQDPNTAVRLSRDDATEHLRLLSVQDVSGKSLIFIADSDVEAELLFCGLKLLLECETARLGVRGGVPINEIGGKLRNDALTPAAARGSPLRSTNASGRHDAAKRVTNDVKDVSKYSSLGETGSSSDGDEIFVNKLQAPDEKSGWSQASLSPNRKESVENSVGPRRAHVQLQSQESPTYVLGKEISNDVASNMTLPLPFDMCRLLLLDSASPLNKTWESERGDADYQHGGWSFPPSSRRVHEKGLPEEQLISTGSMLDAQRIRSYTRSRNREKVALSEVVFVQKDDKQGLVFVIADRSPRRGFSAKARIQLRPYSPRNCAIKIISEIRPVGKNLNNQDAVHKAFVLVLDEMKSRYGIEGTGLLAVFLKVCKGFPTSPRQSSAPTNPSPSSASQRNLAVASPTSSITSFKDMMESKGSPTPTSQYSGNTSSAAPRISSSPNRSQQAVPGRSPANQAWSSVSAIPVKQKPSMNKKIDSKALTGLNVDEVPQRRDDNLPLDEMDNFANFSDFDNIPRNPVTVEVKPLPKIRLDLCPVPREEDEDEDSEEGDTKHKKKSKSSRKHRRKSTRAK